MIAKEALIEAFIEALRRESYIDVSAHSFWERDDDTGEMVRKVDPQDTEYWMPMIERFCAAMHEHLPEGWALVHLADIQAFRELARDAIRAGRTERKEQRHER